jgi:Tfp pilus assembly protein PilF
LTVSLALGLTVGCHRDPNKQKQQYLASGKRYADQGKFKEATIQFANALKVDRNFAEAHYQLSKVLIKQGSMLPAYGELMRTVDLQPANVPARIDLGNLLVAGRQPVKAAEQANAVLAIDPNNADALALLSSVAIANGDRAEALVEIQKALAIDPNRASFHASLGFLQSADPATSAAGEDQLRKAVSLDSKNVAAHLVLASLLQKKGDIQGAEDQMKAAIAGDPKNVMARASLAELYLRRDARHLLHPHQPTRSRSSHLRRSRCQASQEHAAQGCLSASSDPEQGSAEGEDRRRGTRQDRP